MSLIAPSEKVRHIAELDAIDRRILDILQRDVSTPVAEVASRAGLSQTPTWRRIQRLERDGVIRSRVAVLDPEKLGLALTVIVNIQIEEHSTDVLQKFVDAIIAMPEVIEADRLAGVTDYVLRVVARDTAGFDDFYNRLVKIAPLKSVTSHIVLQTVKKRSPIPVK